MRLAIFGATGQTGKPLLEQALAEGHTIVALVRETSKLCTKHERLSVVQGDVIDQASVDLVVRGADAVISVLNTKRNAKSKPLTQGMQHIITAMKRYGVRRLVASSSAPSASDPNDCFDLRFKLLTALVKLVVRSAYEDIAGSVKAVQQSEIDWTIVRMPLPTNAPRTGRVKVSYVNRQIGMRISRADAAEYILKEMQESRYLRHTPVISN